MASLFVQARRVCAVYSARAPTYLRRATAGAHAPLANAMPRTLAPLAAALSPGKAAARLYATDAGEESAARGWMPTDSVLHADAEELDQEWTPTGTGGYPADWSEHNETEWTQDTQRAGVLAVKLGMTQTWDAWGLTIPVTVLQLKDNQVVEVRTKAKNNVDALVVGAIDHPRPFKLRTSAQGMFKSKKLTPKRALVQFKTTDNATLAMGDEITAAHFVPGQYVDTISKTIGKGTAGVMKRHGMKGGNASHGTTKTYRKMGATGGGQDPGRVWPGKKMAGRMGNKRVLTLSLQVHKIDTRWNVIYVKGAVSGAPGTVVTVSDARRKKSNVPLPCPTARPGVVPAGVHIAPPTDYDPGEWPLVSTP